MHATVYKIVSRSEWAEAEKAGQFTGSPLDLADGFIHLSARQQTEKTAALYFADRSDLLLLSVDAASLGDTLRWEKSRDGQLFPHVYGVIEMSSVQKVQPLELDPGGKHQFPSDF
jgi:uncharacterized protein (DUF952 family)